jgi:hypothetical protein
MHKNVSFSFKKKCHFLKFIIYILHQHYYYYRYIQNITVKENNNLIIVNMQGVNDEL